MRAGCPVVSHRWAVGGLAAAYLLGMVRRPPREIELKVSMDRHDPCVDGLELAVRRIPRCPGRPRVTRVLTDLDEQDCDSRLEWDFRVEAKERGFEPYPEPFPFRCRDGIVIAIDVAFPVQWVSGECDGWGSHSDRASLTKHHRRQNRAVADGWRPCLIDWTRLKFHADALFDELAGLLASADPTRPPAEPADPDEIDPRFRARRAR